MKITKLPKTIAIIPDGNRRWARKNNESVYRAYDIGAKRFIEFCEWCNGYGIKDIVVWGLSTENVGRPKDELDSLFKVYSKRITSKDVVSKLHKMNYRLIVVGEKKLLPKFLVSDLKKIAGDTKSHNKHRIFWLLGYGGRDDIAFAAKKIALKIKKGRVGKISQEYFRQNMLSSEVPDIDLIIRTANEFRLSGFMPWQSAYSELYIVKKYWPDFTKKDLEKAITAYSMRDRTFGV
jgi:tritrans,polycis-undecaprenyl-diphosphate synthase [geranylgeranyl-diphosphate specific]